MFESSTLSRCLLGRSARAPVAWLVTILALVSAPCPVALAATASRIELVKTSLYAEAANCSFRDYNYAACLDSACTTTLNVSTASANLSATLMAHLPDTALTVDLQTHSLIAIPNCPPQSTYAFASCSLSVEVPDHVRLTLTLLPQLAGASGAESRAEIHVYDLEGRLLQNCEVVDPAQPDPCGTTLDLDPGQYVVRVLLACSASELNNTSFFNHALSASLAMGFREEEVCIGSSSSAIAAVAPISEWRGGDGDFSDPQNWSPEGEPGPAHRVRIAPVPAINHSLRLSSSPTTLDLDLFYATVALELSQGTWRLNEYESCGLLRALQIHGSGPGQVGHLTVIGPGELVVNGDALLNPGSTLPSDGPLSILTLTNGAKLVMDQPGAGNLELGPNELPSRPTPDASLLEVLDGTLRTHANHAALVGSGLNQKARIKLVGTQSSWSGGDVIIGRRGLGVLELASGAQATLDEITLGSFETAGGAVSVHGANSKLVATGLTILRGGALLGDGGAVEVRNFVSDGNNFTTLSHGSRLDVGETLKMKDGSRILSSGQVNTFQLALGNLGFARIAIDEGGHLDSRFAFLANDDAGGRAEVEIVGGGSQWVTRELIAGTVGEATLTLKDGGILFCQGLAKLGGAIGSRAELNANGAGSMAVFNALDLAFPTGTAHLIGGNNAVVSARHGRTGPGAHLNFNGILVGVPPPPGSGLPRVPVAGGPAGSSFYCDTLTVMPGATITADSLILSANGVIQGEGSLTVPMVNSGILSPGTDSEPGTLTVATDYIQTPAGRLRITVDAGHDLLSVAGSATLAGALEVEVGPNEAAGQVVVLIGHPVVGTFDEVPSGVSVSYSDTSVVVTYESTPTLVSLAQVSAEPGRVHLAWYAADPTSLVAEIQRRTTLTEWTTIGTASLDGSGRFEFVDTDVVAGMRYGYRLQFGSGDAAERLGETWVDVPRDVAFGLAGARPNPTEGDVIIAFSLPDASPARLVLADVAGRIVHSREVGELGPGHHLVNLAGERALKPGLYFARLVSRARVANARVVVTR